MFIKKSKTKFTIIAVYVDDIKLIGTLKESPQTIEYLKEFEVKNLGKIKLCLNLELEYKANRILVHRSAYTKRIFKSFNMDKAHPLTTPMVVRLFEPHKDLFCPKEPDEEILDPEVPYLKEIRVLMYLAQCTNLDIAFTINLLARFSSEPTRRHWNEIKHIFRHLHGTIDLRLFYSKKTTSSGLVRYTNVGYKSNSHKTRSQISYLFCYNSVNTHSSPRFNC